MKTLGFRLAETEIRNHVDPFAIANRARDLRAGELRRLFIAAVAWTVNAVARWNTRHTQRRLWVPKIRGARLC